MQSKVLEDLDFTKRGGLLPVIVQDQMSKDILMLAYVNRDALENTIKTGNAWFWSTSNKKLWMKGEESGNIQPIEKILVDCDADALVYIVNSTKPISHTGSNSCFHNFLKYKNY
jgi:phosphoribosyl-AMP cyclohydrolase